jgi:hypothetical protein
MNPTQANVGRPVAATGGGVRVHAPVDRPVVPTTARPAAAASPVKKASAPAPEKPRKKAEKLDLPIEQRQYISPKMYCAAFACSMSTAYEQMQAGLLKSIKRGRSRLIDVQSAFDLYKGASK